MQATRDDAETSGVHSTRPVGAAIESVTAAAPGHHRAPVTHELDSSADAFNLATALSMHFKATQRQSTARSIA